MKGLNAVAFLSRQEMTQVESPRHGNDLKPLLYNVNALDINLEHSNNPDKSDIGTVRPALRGVTQAWAASVFLDESHDPCDHHQEDLPQNVPLT